MHVDLFKAILALTPSKQLQQQQQQINSNEYMDREKKINEGLIEEKNDS